MLTSKRQPFIKIHYTLFLRHYLNHWLLYYIKSYPWLNWPTHRNGCVYRLLTFTISFTTQWGVASLSILVRHTIATSLLPSLISSGADWPYKRAPDLPQAETTKINELSLLAATHKTHMGNYEQNCTYFTG